jgi:hypothetical protein
MLDGVMSLHITNVITFPGKCNSKTREFAMSEAASTLLAILCHWLRIVLNGTFSKKID